MDVATLPGEAGAWIGTLAGLALFGLAAAALLLRDHIRLERRAAYMEKTIERLQDEAWQASESVERYRSLVEAQPDLIVQRDAAGRITFANDGFAALLDRPRDQLIGTTRSPEVWEARPPKLREDGVRLFDEAISTSRGVRWIAWIETTIAGREGLEILRIGREVTDRVVGERALDEARTKAEAASEAKSRFLATVSHEFRTPLNGILGMADLVLDTPLDPEQTTYVRAVKTSGEALLSLIDGILDFSRIEAGKLDLVAEVFDLHALVEGVVELLAPRAQGKGIEIATFVARGTPRRVIGDGDRLRQVLVNLAGNAVKFTDIGGVGICVSRGEGGTIEIAVHDTGPGIQAQRIPLLFEEFEQGDGSASSRHGGTGLGLAITRRIVARMQGDVQVDSRVGQGSVFRVRLPLPDADGHAPQDEQDEGVRGKRILMLARSPFQAPYLARRLDEAGATVVVVDNAIDAMAKLATAPFDALVADCALGDDVVRDVAAEARNVNVARRVVLLSPFERRDFGSPGAAGFDAYLVKPVRLRSLLERLTQEPPPRPKLALPPRKTRARAGRPGAKRVLLAEDNEINALLALKLLEKLGAIVDWVKDGNEAVALAEASFAGVRPDYDVVLMDIRMPGLDGHEATRRIRRLEAALGRREPYRIIALTANAAKEDEEAAREAGLDEFLAKPFDPMVLGRLLSEPRAPLAQVS